MSKVQDVVDFFIDSAINNPDDNMTNLRINKLLFFAQGWSLAKYNGIPLFDDDFYAWDLGPVIPSVYHRLKKAGKNKITNIINKDYDKNFSEEEQRLLIDVLRMYSKYSTSGLVDMTHKNGTPWRNVYDSQKDNLISKDEIKAYFSMLPRLKTFSMPELSDRDFVGYRDPTTNNYVLPRNWSDE